MGQHRFSVIPAVYLVLLREAGSSAGGRSGTEVLLQLRRGTTFMDGWWACGAAGHVERGETLLEAAVREAEEELAIRLDPADLELAVTTTRTCLIPDDIEERVDVFLVARSWEGEAAIAEEHKAAELRWFPLDDLPEHVVPHERAALDAVAAGATPAVQSHGFDQRLTLIAAVARNGVIGDGEDMPWHLPDDLRFFKETTSGGVLLMGRGTFDSIGRALPGRRTVVVTRDKQWSAPGAEVGHSLREALLIAGDGEVFVAGGGTIYAQTIEHAHRLIITEVDLEPEGTTRFPAIDPALWAETSRTSGPDGTPIRAFVTYARR